MSLSSQNKGRFTLEITTTNLCNFRCEYCFENDFLKKEKNLVNKNPQNLIDGIRNLLNDGWFKENFNHVEISFWGGEPSLNLKLIEKIFNEFYKDKNITFFIFSNGSKIKEMMPFFLKCKGTKINNIPKFRVQVSYDGKPLQDLRRKTKNGTGSTEIVLQSIDFLYRNGIDFNLKSTVCFDDFKYILEAWDDYRFLSKKYGPKIKYALTTDYHNPNFYENKTVVEKTLIEIAKKEFKFYKEKGRFLSNIFEQNKGVCGCGKNLTTVDVMGDAYFCHGCIYSEEIKPFSSIFSQDFPEKIKENSKKFYRFEPRQNECENCVANLCLRCNVKKYETSQKKEFFEKWYDLRSQTELCDYFKLSGRIGRALKNVLSEEK